MSSPFPLCHVKAHKRDVNPSLNYHPGFICLPTPIHLPAINWRCINSCTLSNLSSDCKKGRYNLKTRYCPSSTSVLIHTSQNGHIHRFVYFSHFNGLSGETSGDNLAEWVQLVPHIQPFTPLEIRTLEIHTLDIRTLIRTPQSSKTLILSCANNTENWHLYYSTMAVLCLLIRIYS